MFALTLILIVAPDDGLAQRMLPVYRTAAESYTIATEADPKAACELKKEPVLEWYNAPRGDTQGAVFVWTRQGRPAAVGTIFSYPHERLPGRVIVHELHCLAPDRLVVSRPEGYQWEPKTGLARKELTGAPAPAATPAARLIQLRRLAAEFGGHTLDYDGKRWELRLLPTPVIRYPEAKDGVIDGALFALVSNAGTDPEVFLVLEAKAGRWEYACARFTDWRLSVTRNGNEVLSLPHPPDPDVKYRVFPEKVVDKAGKRIARYRSTDPVDWNALDRTTDQ